MTHPSLSIGINGNYYGYRWNSDDTYGDTFTFLTDDDGETISPGIVYTGTESWTDSDGNERYDYWISSPSAYSVTTALVARDYKLTYMRIYEDEEVTETDGRPGIRPTVAIDSGVTLTYDKYTGVWSLSK